MDERSEDGMYLVDSDEPGRRNQCNFLHPEHLKGEAEVFFDGSFNHILQSYGADNCQTIFGGEGHVRREAQIRSTTKVTEYLQNLNLQSITDMVQKR